MIKSIVVPALVAASVAVAGPASAFQLARQDASDHAGLPPREYRRDAEVTVRFSSDVAKDCRDAGLSGHTAMTQACAIMSPDGVVLIVPNPCRQVGKYARDLCHELGHANGWRPDHGV